jgi:hypothetical protein
MKIHRHVAPPVALVVGLLLLCWHFHFGEGTAGPDPSAAESRDPFAPANDTMLARAVSDVVAPIRRFEWVRERRAIGKAGWIAMQGVWEGPVFVDGKRVELRVRVNSSHIFFEKAPHWPVLERKAFQIEENDGEWIPYFMTDLGIIHIQTPSELIADGGSPDEMFLRTSGFLKPSEENLKMNRSKE